MVQYLNSRREEALRYLIYDNRTDAEAIGRCRAVARFVEELIELPQELAKVKIPTEEEKKKMSKMRNDSYGVPQAVAMGQTRYTEIEAED